jgi:hypothetical protein
MYLDLLGRRGSPAVMTKRTGILGPGSAESQLKDNGCDCITLTDAVSMAEVSSRWV